MGIRYQLSFYFIVLSTVTVLAVGFLALSSVIDDKKNYITELNSFLGPQIAESLDQRINSLKVELLSLQSQSVKGSSHLVFVSQLTKIKTQYPEVKAIFLGEGKETLKTLALVTNPEELADIEKSAEQLKQTPHLQVIAGQFSHLFGSVYAITDKNIFIAVVLSLDFYKSAFQLARGRPAVLINRQNEILFGLNFTIQQNHLFKKIPMDVWQNKELISVQIESVEKTGYLVNFARPQNLNSALVAVLAPTPSVGQLLRPIIKPSLGIFVMLILLSILAAFIISRKMAEPIEALALWANQIGEGQWLQLNLQNTGPEIETLSKSFHLMMKNLKARETDLQQAQHKIIHSESLAAVGRMSAGIAHEVKNPLGSVLGYAQLINLKIEAQKKNGDFSAVIPTIESYVKLILEDTRRASKIISDLLTFSRQKEIERKSMTVTEFTQSLAPKLFGYCETQQIQFKINHLESKQNTRFEIDPEQLYQVIFNLTQNAAHALAQKPQGERKIEVSAVVEQSNVIIEVKDNGSGIATENLKKIFEPFFSTKQVGEGSGLGLAICHGIVIQHGGTIEVDSVVNQYTCFKIKLPVQVSQ